MGKCELNGGRKFWLNGGGKEVAKERLEDNSQKKGLAAEKRR